MMRPEDKSFLSGMIHGIWDGGLKGFVIGGLVGVALALAGGAIGAAFGIGTLASLSLGIGTMLTSFLMGGAVGAFIGSPVGAIYEGVNEYIEEKEVQRDIERARKLGYIENYTLRSPEKATPPPTPLQTAQASKPVDAPQTKHTVEDTHQESIEAINKIKSDEKQSQNEKEEIIRKEDRVELPKEERVALPKEEHPILPREKWVELPKEEPSTPSAPNLQSEMQKTVPQQKQATTTEPRISAVERLNAERMAAAQNTPQSCAI